MYLKSASDFLLHRTDCKDPTNIWEAPHYQYPDEEVCSCCVWQPDTYRYKDRRVHFDKGTPVCLISIEDGVATVLGPGGQIGKIAPFTWFTKICWRFNSVVIRHIKDWNGEDLFVAMILLAVFVGLSIGGYCLIKTATASGKIDECYVKQDHTKNNGIDGPVYAVQAHRSWRSDEIIYSTKSYDDALAKMKDACPK